MDKEKLLKNKVIKYLKTIPDSFTWKISDNFYSGIPDVFFVHKGRSMFFELKSDTGVVSDIQAWTIGEIHKAGMEAYIVYSLDDVKKILSKGEKYIV